MELRQRIFYLLDRIDRQEATAEETQAVAALIDQHLDPALQQELIEYHFSHSQDYPTKLNDLAAWYAQLDTILAMDKVDEKLTPAPVHKIPLVRRNWFRYAAVLILLLCGAVVWYTQFHQTKTTNQTTVAVQSADITPGTNRAMLTVGNNQPINLSNDKKGIAVGTAITYNDGERIADAGQMLTLATPRGGQYQAVLPDGSKVWLNAASFIRFPSKFSGNKREVEVSGEVYMEVAQKHNAPFSVTTGNTIVQVLGTSFNINAYPDEEEQKTTLVSGSVKVVSNNQAAILQPGQQARIPITQITKIKQITVQTTDVEQALAWKNGLFNFYGLDLHSVMKQLERWYDIKVQYEGTMDNIVFKGKLDRGIQLKDILEYFAKDEIGIRSRIEGKTLILRKY